MKINEAIETLWKEGYFQQHRTPKEVKARIFKKYGLTAANISQHLAECKKFIRNEQAGWIQKLRHDPQTPVTPSSRKNSEKLFDDEALWAACKSSFESDEFWDACLHALRHLETRIREKCRLAADDHGIDLINKAFNPDRGILKIPSCATKSEEEGFLAINRGIVLFHRNAKGHREGSMSRRDAIKIIGYVDYLLEILKTAQTRAG